MCLASLGKMTANGHMVEREKKKEEKDRKINPLRGYMVTRLSLMRFPSLSHTMSSSWDSLMHRCVKRALQCSIFFNVIRVFRVRQRLTLAGYGKKKTHI